MMRECPFLPIGSGGFSYCRSSCMAYYETTEPLHNSTYKKQHCRRLEPVEQLLYADCPQCNGAHGARDQWNKWVPCLRCGGEGKVRA